MKMKRGLKVWADYDKNGRWYLAIEKKKGKLTLDEIRETAMEYESDFYALIVEAVEKEIQSYFDWDFDGDFVRLYRATDFLDCEK